MGKLVNIATSLHESSKREYLVRMVDDKVNCMKIAKQYDKNYWDGDRRYGYGGYNYMPGRWKPVAEILIQKYNLTNTSSVLDVGCGKAYLLYEMKLLLPGLRVAGFDISEHGLAGAQKEIQDSLFIHRAQDAYPFDENEFDLVISLGCFHNLRVFDLENTLAEIERVGRQGYVMLESYRNELEQFNLQCWALTCESFFDHEEWPWIYEKFGYTGDYEFIYFT
jgi:SAM-dependent methyltransferase